MKRRTVSLTYQVYVPGIGLPSVFRHGVSPLPVRVIRLPVMVAGIRRLKTSRHEQAATQYVDYLLSENDQNYNTGEVFEYQMTEDVEPNPKLVSLDELERRAP